MGKPSPLDFRALPVNDADLIPFYIGSDISKPFWVTWRDLKKILASTLPSGSGVLLKTNGVTNPVQTLLNLVAGTNMTIVNDGLGNITFTSTGGGAVDSVNGQTGVVVLALNDISDVNAPSPSVGQLLQWNGTEWVAATVSGSGTVTNVGTGTGLTGGPITNSGTISLNSKLAPADSLTGNSLKYLRVNAGETAVEYATVSTGDSISPFLLMGG